ncbi:Oidioi.mRNA.OKI2018_I69.chr2.g5301.t1.cds [Oikopleura dioica]|uniref:Oidioi.mRNA.OKI2018_I69.chr2.g5301.t1.cds n=1 Tax=Oikopleura dioica TaxID=34765 RepID=A0ABN7T4A5_OIKDI|nr:Oidioi.mRNA.OKI2018_I69.chr2.g5301.t1.cds [Oikopleura dioica]
MNMDETTISSIIYDLHKIEAELESRLHASLNNLQDHFRSLWHSIDVEEEKFIAIVKRYTTEEQFETTRETAKMSIYELSEDHQRQIYELDVVFEDLSRKNAEK